MDSSGSNRVNRQQKMVYRQPSDPNESPPFYHARIEFYESADRDDYAYFDYTYAEVRSLIVEPFRSDETFFVEGRRTVSSDIERIRIWESSQSLVEEAAAFGISAESYQDLSWDDRLTVVDSLKDSGDVILMTPLFPDPLASTSTPAIADPRKVFVVHGRDDANRDALYTLLRALHLKPVEWPVAVQGTGQGAPSTDGVLTDSMPRAKAVVVLLTPDEEVRLKSHLAGNDPVESAWRVQPRPNVIYEAGRARETHPETTVFFQVGDFDEFSDIAGMQRIVFRGGASQLKILADRLKTLGCEVDDSGTDWLDATKFVVRE